MASIRDHIKEALQRTGLDADEENIGKLERTIQAETGGDPAFDVDGFVGITAMHREVWEDFNAGANPFDPVANIVCCIKYQLYRFQGRLIDFYPVEVCTCNQSKDLRHVPPR